MDLPDIIENRILILDGAMGTMLQKKKIPETNFEYLNIANPDIIGSVHRAYVDAGADIIETNTFNANKISQEAHGCGELAGKMAFEGARIARKVADESIAKGHPAWVSGSIGLTSKSLSLSTDGGDAAFRQFGFDEMAESFREQISNLIKGGADMIQLETCFDALNAKAAIYALESVNCGFPLIISVSVNDKSGRTLTGQTLEAFYTSVRHYPLLAFGLNCSLGAEELAPLAKEVAEFSDLPLICYPNAGIPNEAGEYDETPEKMAGTMGEMADAGLLNIAGGCCGTTPDHIRAIAEAVRGKKPRPIKKKDSTLTVSGLESYRIDLENNNFTNIGERTNVAGSRKFAKLIASGDYESALQVAAGQIDNGANIIDINMDDALLDSTKEMEKFVRYAENDPSVAKAALMIDSSHWDSILAGLKNAQGKSIVNSISLKDGEDVFLAKAKEINNLGGAMVVMAFDETGQAVTYERKISICKRAYSILTEKAGISPGNIIFDANVLSIGTGIEEHSRYATDFIEAVRWIKKNLKGAYTSGGISNLSFAFRGNNKVREALHSAFLFHATKAGLDMGIVNPEMLQVYDDIEPSLLECAEDVIFDKDPHATERLTAKAQEILSERYDAEAPAKLKESEAASPEDRLKSSLVQGRSANIREDVLSCYEKYGSAVKVIEGPLMDGMENVGKLFSEGKMFLPQVVKSAKTMKECVSILHPYMDDNKDREEKHRPRIVMATVKGDVHDIGKNITGIVLNCNGFEIIDLGVMVETERIIDAAIVNKADIIAVSGLITPSLYQMELLCKELESRKMDIPLFIGGATTSALHTALKLAPCYGHVFYGADASSSAVKAKRCISDRKSFEDEEHKEQKRILDLYNGKKETKAVRTSEPAFPADTFLRPEEYDFEDMPAFEVPIGEAVRHFDKKMFLAIWGIRYVTAVPGNPEINKTLEEAGKTLAEMVQSHECTIRLAASFFSSWSEDGYVFIAPKDQLKPDNKRIIKQLPMLRQGKVSLCDFVPDKRYGITGPLGVFAISVSPSNENRHAACESCSDDYAHLMKKTIMLTLAEAASEWLDSVIATSIRRKGIKVVKPASGYSSCPDHTVKKDILELLGNSKELGISFTDSYAMIPDASICGFIFAHPNACYPEIRGISQYEADEYAKRRGLDKDAAEKFLGNLIR